MSIMEEKLWNVLEQKAKDEDENLRPDQRIASEYLTGIKFVCDFGIDRAKTIRDNFPMYTLHDETHICNVLRKMADLLGDAIDKLSRDEAAMLVLAACCHDIGMSYSEEEKAELLGNTDRLIHYLEHNHSEYVKAYTANPDEPKLTDEMLQKYLRSIHHERASELLHKISWPAVLWGKVDRDNLVCICQSHGESVPDLSSLENTPTADLRFCAILLRLADILDFDTSRAPKAVYDYSGFDHAEGSDAKISKEEWQKHMASQGFDFSHVPDRKIPYDLPYHAVSKSMQIEQTVNSYLDWVDYELNECNKLLRRYTGNWQDFMLPIKIKRTIKTEGYVSGQYHLTMDQDQIMELLVGEELYSDPSVFVRELIQNAIDAVRTREQLDKNLPRNWKPQVNIRCWIDEEGYHWFRIEDNGTGMTKDIIEDYFLKIGSSYYTSDDFQKEKIRCRADPDYTPISRFGIGILSCFMGDKDSNQVEISTKRFGVDGDYPSALRLSMHGMSGYYYLASQQEGHRPGPMKGITGAEKEPYLKAPGTVVAVRTNLYQTGKYTGFKEIVDCYVVYPPIPIHYSGAEGSFDYTTKNEFVNAVHGIHPSDNLSEQGVLEFPLTEEQCQKVSEAFPGLVFDVPPKIVLKCVPLDRYTKSPYLSGAVLTAKIVGNHDALNLRVGNQTVKAKVGIEIKANDAKDALSICISLQFPPEFRRSMELIEGKCREQKYFSPEVYRDLIQMYEGVLEQGLILEILRALAHHYIIDPMWKRDICCQWPGLSMRILNQSIRAVEQKYQEITGKTLPDENELRTLKKFRQYSNDCEILLCKLDNYEWYKKYFCDIFDRTHLRGVVAHNGILCGDSQIFLDLGSDVDTYNLGAIILLQDKFRPGVDVARLGIRELSLEMACDFALIQACLKREGFSCGKRYFSPGVLLKNKPVMIPESIYGSLLTKRPDLEERLIFETDKGSCNCEVLKKLVEIQKRLCLEDNTALERDKYIEQDQMLYQLRLTYLKQHYDLHMKLAKYSTGIYITEKNISQTVELSNIFPAALFLSPEEECRYLTNSHPYLRYFCNSDHRFSKFILKNSDLLYQKAPGILKELVRVLQEEEGEQLVQLVNNLLSLLRGLPGQPIEIVDDIFLTKDDLC